MFEKFAKIQIENGYITDEEKDIVIHGLKGGMMMLLNFVSTICIGVLFGMFWQSIIFLLIYSPLRIFAGGAHANSNLKCFLSSIVITMLALISIKYFPDNYITITSIAVFAGVIILILAPVEDRNKPLDNIEIKVYKKRACIVLLMEILSCTAFLILKLNAFAICIAVSIFTLSITLVIGQIKNTIQIAEECV